MDCLKKKNKNLLKTCAKKDKINSRKSLIQCPRKTKKNFYEKKKKEKDNMKKNKKNLTSLLNKLRKLKNKTRKTK